MPKQKSQKYRKKTLNVLTATLNLIKHCGLSPDKLKDLDVDELNLESIQASSGGCLLSKKKRRYFRPSAGFFSR